MNEAKLTAYALGQLSEAERAEVERHITDEASRQTVDEAARVAQCLRSDLSADPLPTVSPALRAAVEQRLNAMSDVLLPLGEGARRADEGAPPITPAPREPRQTSRVSRTHWFSLALAASVLLMFGIGLFLPAVQSAREMRRVAEVPSVGTPAELERLHGLKTNPTFGFESDKLSKNFALPINEPEIQAGAPQIVGGAPAPSAWWQSDDVQYFPPGHEVKLQLEAADLKAAARSKHLPAIVAAEQPGRAMGGMGGGGLGAPEREFNTEAYDAIVENAFLKVLDNPLSTFSIDVDTASYSNVRRFLTSGHLPPPGAVRIEELVNYFSYDYPQPTADRPFSVTTEVADCPWAPTHRLVRIGLKGREVSTEDRPASNLVFLLDVSGSMEPANKLPLVKQAMRMLAKQLTERDHVAIVVYAGASGLVPPSTSGDNRETIESALDRLQAGGSTNGASGIELAYQTAQQHFVRGGINRVILCTDGDFNVGTTNQDELVRLIEAKAKSGVFLSALGFGMGNLKDSTLEKLADKGNGNYAYIDTLREARKVLVEQMSGTLLTIAKDVKIQVEFNPAKVGAYRLIGYENRMLAAQDFNDDKKDAGEIGAGHTVTALYELVPVGAETSVPRVDALKYQKAKKAAAAADSDELLTVKLRYKQPDGDTSQLIEQPLADRSAPYAQVSGDFKFAASVAAFGMVLRHSQNVGAMTLDAVLELATEGKGADLQGHRAEFLDLVRMARNLQLHAPSK